MLHVELDVGEYVLQGLDVALEDIHVRVASLDRGVELVLSKADLGLDRREPTSPLNSEISRKAAPIWTQAKASRMTKANDQFQMPRMPYHTGPSTAAAALKVHVKPDLLPTRWNCRS